MTLISRHSALRTIIANELHVMSSDANEQLAMAGLNDPVRMFGTLWCVLDCNQAGWQVRHAGQAVALLLGRMEVLFGLFLLRTVPRRCSAQSRAWHFASNAVRHVCCLA